MAATDNAAEQVAHIAEKIRAGKTTLGIEFGSTRIKAVLIDDTFQTIASGDYSWASHLEDGLWSYTTEEIWGGLQSAYASMANDVETAYGEKLTHVGHIGFSAMMHGYLAFDEAGELLVPFRTWQNTNTSEAHKKLSELFQYNIPERWSIAHLYQAVLNKEEHVSKVAYLPHSPVTCTGSSPVRRSSAWAMPPACSRLTRPLTLTKPHSLRSSTLCLRSQPSRGSWRTCFLSRSWPALRLAS